MTKQDCSDALMTTEDVRAHLRINARTVYRLIRAGDLRAVRVGRQWRVRRRDLDRFLAARSVATSCSAVVNQ